MPVRFPPPDLLETHIPAPEWLNDGVYDDSSGGEESLAGFWDSESSFYGDGYPLVSTTHGFDDGDGRPFFDSMRDIAQLECAEPSCASADFEKSITLSDLVYPDNDDFQSVTEQGDELDSDDNVFEHQKANILLRFIQALVSRMRGHHDDDGDDAGFNDTRHHSQPTSQQATSTHPVSEQALKRMNKSAGQESTRGGAFAKYSGA